MRATSILSILLWSSAISTSSAGLFKKKHRRQKAGTKYEQHGEVHVVVNKVGWVDYLSVYYFVVFVVLSSCDDLKNGDAGNCGIDWLSFDDVHGKDIGQKRRRSMKSHYFWFKVSAVDIDWGILQWWLHCISLTNLFTFLTFMRSSGSLLFCVLNK